MDRGESRRRFLRVSVAGLAGATVASLLSACGGQQQPAPAKEAPKSAPAPAAPAAKPAAPAPAAASPVAKAADKPADKPAQAAPAFAGGGSLNILMRAHFIPNFDKYLDKFAADWGEKNKVQVQVDHILAGELPAKWAAEVAAGSGHDLYGFTQSGAVNLYNKQLVDMSDVATAVGQKYGGWVDPLATKLGQFEGKWLGVPDFFIEFGANYRKDLFDANNLQAVDKWEDLLKVGEVLKPLGNPIGIAINQKSNDANNSWNSMLWGYGQSYAKEDGKMANINTPEFKEAVRFAVELYNKGMTDEVLSWDDTANNQGQLSGRISWIQNPISSLRTIEKEKPDLAKNIFISNAPAGPKGRFASVSTSVFGVMNWSKNVPAVKAFLTDYFADYANGFKQSEGYNQPLLKDFRKKPMPILGEDPKLQLLQDFDQVARVFGNPGPPTAAAAEVESNWIVPLMIGRAVQGSPDDAVQWAAQRIEQIYQKHNLV